MKFKTIPSVVSHIMGVPTQRQSGRLGSFMYLGADGQELKGYKNIQDLINKSVESGLFEHYTLTSVSMGKTTTVTHLFNYGSVGSFHVSIPSHENYDGFVVVRYSNHTESRLQELLKIWGEKATVEKLDK